MVQNISKWYESVLIYKGGKDLERKRSQRMSVPIYFGFE